MVSFKLTSAIAIVAACLLVANAQTPLPPDLDCNITQVCFAIDQSGSINNAEYIQEQEFVVEIATLIKGIAPNVELSAVAFADMAEQIQAPTSILDDFSDTVNGPRRFPGVGTMMSGGLSECFGPLQPLDGNRIIVLVTDGVPNVNDVPATIDVADSIRVEEDVFLVTVGIGLTPSAKMFLESIAHTPEFAIMSDFGDLPDVVNEVVEKICEVVEPAVCEEAYEECLFQFSGETGLTKYDILPNQPDQAFTPVIVPKDPTKRLGVLNTNGIVPEFIDATGANPITQFGSQPFTPTHFKPFWISADFGSGIGHQTFQGDQATVALDKCVRVYFTSFQVLENVNGNLVVVDNRNNVPRSENKCVVFET